MKDVSDALQLDESFNITLNYEDKSEENSTALEMNKHWSLKSFQSGSEIDVIVKNTELDSTKLKKILKEKAKISAEKYLHLRFKKNTLDNWFI